MKIEKVEPERIKMRPTNACDFCGEAGNCADEDEGRMSGSCAAISFREKTSEFPTITRRQRESVKSRLIAAVELINISIAELECDLETTALASENLKTAKGIIAKDIEFLDSRE